MAIINIDKEDEVLSDALESAYFDSFCQFVGDLKKEYDYFKKTLEVYMTLFEKSSKNKKMEVFSKIEDLYVNSKIYADDVTCTVKSCNEDDVDIKNVESFKKEKLNAYSILKQFKEDLIILEDKISKVDSSIVQKVEQEKERREERKKRKRDENNSSSNGSDNNKKDKTGLFGWGIGIY